MKKFFIALLLLLCANCVFAADWVKITDKEFVDKSSITFNENNVTFWFKRLNDGNMEPIKSKEVWFTLARTNINCKDATVQISDIVIYGLKNEILFSESNKYAQHEPIVPDSFMEAYYKIFCKTK